MKLFKSLLLASATGMVAVSGASAADLGAKKPSPVEYVRACYNPLWGTSGGFIIPGTQTCLRVFGRARFDYAYVQPYQRSNSPSGYRGGLDVGLDAITPSEYGNVRAFAQIGMVYRSGNQPSGTNLRNGVGVNGTFPALTNSGGQTELNYTGFIQFAGFTMGRTSSFFATVGGANEVIGAQFRSSPGNVNTIAYTAQLGNGFLATIAVEDPTIRRHGVMSSSLAFANGVLVAPNFVNTATGAITSNVLTPALGAGPFLQIGNRMPNIVAALRVDQAWGSAELSGMVNEVGVNGGIVGINGANGAATGGAFSPSSKYGFAINGGLKINLPMIAAGDNLTLNAVYSEGNLNATGSNLTGNSNTFAAIGGVGATIADATINQVTGSMRLTKAWGVSAGFQHFWTPTLNSTLFGSYGQVDVANTPLLVTDTLRDWTYWTVGLNTVWQPVRGLNIALEGIYQNLDVQGRMIDLNKNTINGQVANSFNIGACNITTGVNCRLKSSDSAIVGRLRITRDF
jgi:Porin subfamily